MQYIKFISLSVREAPNWMSLASKNLERMLTVGAANDHKEEDVDTFGLAL